MKILILGAQGNLGSQFQLLLQDNYQVFALDQHNFRVINQLGFVNVVELRRVISETRPKLLINCVAYNAVDLAEDPDEYPLALLLNSDLPEELSKLALEFKFTLVHYSSDYVFSGNFAKKAFSEEDLTNPLNKYGFSKALGEKKITTFAQGDLDYYIIRTSKLFGPKGLSPSAKISFFQLMLSLADRKSELKIVDEELSRFTYTPDLAQMSLQLIKSGSDSGIYHLTNEGEATWYEAAQEMFKLKKKNIELKAILGADLKRPALRPKFSILQNNKFTKLRPYQEALAEYLQSI